jgi:glucokinase
MARRKTSPRPDDAVSLGGELHLGSHLLVFDDDEVIQLLRAAVEREGNQVAFARRHDLDRVYLNMVLNRKRPVGEKVAKALGLRKVYTA